MKFFLEFVSCCGLGGGSREEVRETARRGAEESRALVRKASATERTQRRRRKRIRSADSACEWKPTLQAISEYNSAAVEHRAEKRKGSIGRGGSRNIASVTSYRDDNQRNHFPTAIPAFSATPFMI